MLLYNGETVRLERFDGKVRLDRAEFEPGDIWTPALKLAGVRFERAALAQPFR